MSIDTTTAPATLDLSPDAIAPVPYPFNWPSPLTPPDEYRTLRDRPAVPVTIPSGDKCYLITRYDDVRRMLTDPRVSKNLDKPGAARISTSNPLFGGVPLDPDPPNHTRVRRAVGKGFTPRSVERLRLHTQELCDQLLDAMAEMPQPVDLNEALCFPLTIRLMCGLLGVPYEDEMWFRKRVDTFGALFGVPAAEVQRTRMELWAYIGNLITERRKNPKEDLISTFVGLTDDEALSELELAYWTQALLLAGYETTAAQLGSSMILMSTHYDQWEKLRDDPSLVNNAVEELLRCQVMFTSNITMMRLAMEDIELSDGVIVPAGSSMIPEMISANRDERMFPDPDRLDITRQDNHHLSFSAGPHYCMGVSLARMELQVATEGLVRRFPNLRLAIPPEELRRNEGVLLERYIEIPVVW